MREARKTPSGRWYMVEEEGGGVCRIVPSDWGKDAEGYWPRVNLQVRGFGEAVACPHCGTTWVFEEMDCVFGMSRKEHNDILVLVRCVNCRLPHRTRAVGFVTAYPRVVRLMEGWANWEKRRADFAAEERRLFGRASDDESP
ncbi:MAG: hypothetical protein Kow0092_11060 [Deferrisomatales bacterium]